MLNGLKRDEVRRGLHAVWDGRPLVAGYHEPRVHSPAGYNRSKAESLGYLPVPRMGLGADSGDIEAGRSTRSRSMSTCHSIIRSNALDISRLLNCGCSIAGDINTCGYIYFLFMRV